MATTITTFFFLICIIALSPPPSHGTTTASGDTAKASPKTVDNVVEPKDIRFLPRQTPPFFFHYYYFRFPRYRFPLTGYHHRPYYGYSSPATVPRPQTPPESSPAISPPPQSPPPPPPPPPPSSPIGIPGRQGSFPDGTIPGSSGVAAPPPPSPKWVRPRLFPWWSRPRFFAAHPYPLQWPFHFPNWPSTQNNPPPQHP